MTDVNLFNWALSVQGRDASSSPAKEQTLHCGLFSPGMERRNTKPINLSKEDSREMITGSLSMQTPYFIVLFWGLCVCVCGLSYFSVARYGSSPSSHIVKICISHLC